MNAEATQAKPLEVLATALTEIAALDTDAAPVHVVLPRGVQMRLAAYVERIALPCVRAFAKTREEERAMHAGILRCDSAAKLLRLAQDIRRELPQVLESWKIATAPEAVRTLVTTKEVKALETGLRAHAPMAKNACRRAETANKARRMLRQRSKLPPTHPMYLDPAKHWGLQPDGEFVEVPPAAKDDQA